jgi:hypothetical protein
MRPRYERPDDRVRQWDAILGYCHALGVVPRCTDELAAWDYTLWHGQRMVAIVEVKCRRCASYSYPTYLIGIRKMETLRDEAARRGVPGRLLVRWTDGSGVIDATDALETAGRAQGGRADRDDPEDMEPVLHIPIARFSRV